MYNFTIPMALMDFIPVVFFGVSMVLLQRDLYNKMGKGAYALFAAGTINVFAAGFLKALWKLLYAAGICDFQALNTMFLPVQSIGFLLIGVGLVGMFCRKKTAALAVALPIFGGSMVFIMMMVAGLGCQDEEKVAHCYLRAVLCELYGHGLYVQPGFHLCRR